MGQRRKKPKKKAVPVQVQVEPRVVIPNIPHFYPVHIAILLGVQRSMVKYWIDNRKLAVEQDYSKATYVTRSVLIAFVREYLKKECE